MMKTAILATAALMAATPVAAEPKVETVSAVVEFGDLDLDTAAGEKLLAKRIDAARRKLCGYPVGSNTSAYHEYKACKMAVLEQAREKLAEIGIEKASLVALR